MILVGQQKYGGKLREGDFENVNYVMLVVWAVVENQFWIAALITPWNTSNFEVKILRKQATLFPAKVFLLYTVKSENAIFSDVFRGYKKGDSSLKWVN